MLGDHPWPIGPSTAMQHLSSSHNWVLMRILKKMCLGERVEIFFWDVQLIYFLWQSTVRRSWLSPTCFCHTRVAFKCQMRRLRRRPDLKTALPVARLYTHTDTLAHIAIALHFYWVDSIFLLVETTCFYSQFPVFLVGMLFRDGDISMAIG